MTNHYLLQSKRDDSHHYVLQSKRDGTQVVRVYPDTMYEIHDLALAHGWMGSGPPDLFSCVWDEWEVDDAEAFSLADALARATNYGQPFRETLEVEPYVLNHSSSDSWKQNYIDHAAYFYATIWEVIDVSRKGAFYIR